MLNRQPDVGRNELLFAALPLGRHERGAMVHKAAVIEVGSGKARDAAHPTVTPDTTDDDCCTASVACLLVFKEDQVAGPSSSEQIGKQQLLIFSAYQADAYIRQKWVNTTNHLRPEQFEGQRPEQCAISKVQWRLLSNPSG